MLAEGVDPEEAQSIAESHTHSDAPHIADKRANNREDSDGSPKGSGSGGVQSHMDGGDDDAEAEHADPDDRVAESTDDALIEDQLDEMDEMDDDRASGGWWDVSGDEDYTEVSDEFVRRFKRVQQEVEKARSDVGQRIAHRDECVEEGRHQLWSGDQPSDRLREQQSWQDLRDDIADAFRQLKTRDTPTPSRKGSALNMDAIVQRNAGDRSRDKLFTRKQTAAKGDRAIGVSTDFSGSMYEEKVRLALAAIAEATRIIGDDFTANCWTNDNRNRFGKSRGDATLGIITGPDEEFDWSHIDAFGTGGGTPTADGVDDMSEVLNEMTAREKVMIVVTDGKPNVAFGGDQQHLTGDATEDAAYKVREARQDGIKVIGLGVGHVDDNTMSRVFGPNGFVSADMDDLAEKLVEVYRRQINA